MDKRALDQLWDQMRQQYGIFLRLLEAIPQDRLASHPVPGMRTAAELAVHLSRTVVRDMAQGVARGKIEPDEGSENKTAAGFKTTAALTAFAKDCWKDANAAVATLGDAQLSAMVPTPWNKSFPGWVGFAIMEEEFLHHRGQLYVYARLFGVQPPDIYSAGQNAPEFRPAA